MDISGNELKIELHNCDCYEFIKTVPGNSVDLVVIDPPYLIENKGSGMYRKGKQYTQELENIKGGFNYDILNELCRVMKSINIYVWCSQKQVIELLEYFVKQKKCNWNILSWHKSNPIPNCGNKYISDTEYCLFFREKGVKVYGSSETKYTYYVQPMNVKDKKLYQHPTIKPLNIIENLITNSSVRGGWYLIVSWVRVLQELPVRS